MCREALMLFMKMKVKGFSPNRVTYKLLIQALVRNSDHEKAALLRNKMHSAGLPPTGLPTTDGLTTEMLAAVP